MAVLSHAVLLIASLLFATPAPNAAAHAHVDNCQSRASSEHAWLPASDEVRVRAYGAMRPREPASVRVLGRCVLKNAPEDAQPILYVPFGTELGNSDDEDVADVRVPTKPQFGRSVAQGLSPADLHAPRAAAGQLERPPRV